MIEPLQSAWQATASGEPYLHAAYVITWVIFIGYIVSLSRRAKRVSDEVKELEK